MQSLLNILTEQALFGFTGRINIIKSDNRQYLGAISQKEGIVVDAHYNGMRSRKALFSALFDDLEGAGHKYVVEPEIIDESSVVFELSLQSIKRDTAAFYQEYSKAKKLKPAAGVRLLVDPDFVIDGEIVTDDEYTVLSTLCEFNKTEDVYKHINLMEYEVTNALVSLRKKKALKVVR